MTATSALDSSTAAIAAGPGWPLYTGDPPSHQSSAEMPQVLAAAPASAPQQHQAKQEFDYTQMLSDAPLQLQGPAHSRAQGIEHAAPDAAAQDETVREGRLRRRPGTTENERSVRRALSLTGLLAGAPKPLLRRPPLQLHGSACTGTSAVKLMAGRNVVMDVLKQHVNTCRHRRPNDAAQ